MFRSCNSCMIIHVFSSHLLPRFIGMDLITTTGTSDFSQCIVDHLEYYSLPVSLPFQRALRDLPGSSYLPPCELDRLPLFGYFHLSGFLTSCKVTHQTSQHRFAFAPFHSLPSDPPDPSSRTTPCLLTSASEWNRRTEEL